MSAPGAGLAAYLPAAPWVAVPAHGVGNRADLPLPFEALVIGAALALLASFVGLAFLWREPRLRPDGRVAGAPGVAVGPRRALVPRASSRGLSLLLTGWVLLALVFGRDDANNPVPYVVYVWLWVGMPFLSLVFGAVWAVLNPVRWLHRGRHRARADPPRLHADRSSTSGSGPRRPGCSPSPGWSSSRRTGRRCWCCGSPSGCSCSSASSGSLTFGRARGSARATRSRCSRDSTAGCRPSAGDRDGRLVLRTPVHGPSLLPARRGLLATAAVMLGGTAYDSLSADIRYAGWVQSTAAPDLARTGTLLGVVVLVGGALHLAAAISAWLSRSPGPRRGRRPGAVPAADRRGVPRRALLLVARLPGSANPGAAQRPARHRRELAGHRRGRAVGLAHPARPWSPWSRPVAIVIGHVLGVVVAHERAIRILPHRAAVVGQVPLMVLMVALHRGRALAAVQRLTRSPRRRRRPLPAGAPATFSASERTAGRTGDCGAHSASARPWSRAVSRALGSSGTKSTSFTPGEAGQRLGHPLLRVGADGSRADPVHDDGGPRRRDGAELLQPAHQALQPHRVTRRRRRRPRRPGRGCVSVAALRRGAMVS